MPIRGALPWCSCLLLLVEHDTGLCRLIPPRRQSPHGHTRGAAVAVSLMAHRPGNLSQCRHALCRCTLALCTHSLWAWGAWGSCPFCLQKQLFSNGTREGACTPSTTCDLPQAFGREIILQFGKAHQMHKRPAGATAKSRPVREHQPPPALRQGCLPRTEKEKNLCPFFWVRRSICRTETNQSQLWRMKGRRQGNADYYD